MAKEALTKGVRLRAKEVLADQRAVRWRSKDAGGKKGGGGGGDEEEKGQDEWGGLD